MSRFSVASVYDQMISNEMTASQMNEFQASSPSARAALVVRAANEGDNRPDGGNPDLGVVTKTRTPPRPCDGRAA